VKEVHIPFYICSSPIYLRELLLEGDVNIDTCTRATPHTHAHNKQTHACTPCTHISHSCMVFVAPSFLVADQ
jgi:hypothetical protein